MSEKPTKLKEPELTHSAPSRVPDETQDNTQEHKPTAVELPGFALPKVQGEIGLLGKYRIQKLLGHGGMGAVYLAFDDRLQRKVALKVMLPKAAANELAKERFLREARAAAQVNSDYVVNIYEAEEIDGIPYIALQYLQGYPLDQYLKKKGLPSLKESMRIGKEMALGLAAAHELGLVHRDIKPGNIWLEAPKGRVKILDFGLAKAVESRASAELTDSGALVGTPAYMSPEQGMGEKVDARTDLFSMGCVLYRLVTGKLPFDKPTLMGILTAIATEEPTAVQQLNPHVSAEFASLIHRLMAKKPANRPASATVVAKELQNLIQQVGQGGESKPLPKVVYAPMAVSVQQSNPFEDIDVETETIAPKPKAEREKPNAKSSMLWLWVMLGFFGLLCCGAAGVIIIKIINKDGTVTEIKVPEGTKIEVDGRTIKPEPKKTKAEPLPSTYAWKPIPVGDSPFDKLDPDVIPKEERFAWQPKELVGMIGSHARRHWWGVLSSAFSPDGKLAATGANGLDYVIIWDMATQTVKHRLEWSESPREAVSSLQFSADGKRVFVGIHGPGGTGVRIADLSELQAKWVPIKVDGKETTEWDNNNAGWQTYVFEEGNTFASWTNGTVSLFDWNNGSPKLVTDKFPIRGSPCVLTKLNQMIYASTQGKLRRVTIKNAKLVDDVEIPIPLDANEAPRDVRDDGKVLAIWVRDHLELWDIDQERPKKRSELREGVSPQSSFKLSPDGRWLTTKFIKTGLWRIDGQEPKFAAWLDQTGLGNVGQSPVGFSSDGNRVIVGSNEGFVRFWDLSGDKPKELSPFDPATAFKPNFWNSPLNLDSNQAQLMLQRYLENLERSSSYQLWNLSAKQPVPMPNATTFLDPDGDGLLQFGGANRWLEMTPKDQWRPRFHILADGRWQPSGTEFGEPDLTGNVSANGRLLVAYSGLVESPDRLEGWDLTATPPTKKWSQSLKEYPAFEQKADRRVWFSADGRWFATIAKAEFRGGPWKLVIWRNSGEKPEVYATLPCKYGPGGYLAAFSPDGRYLAHTPEAHQTLSIVDLSGPKPIEIQNINDWTRLRGLRSLAFHPDGKHLAYGWHFGVGMLEVTSGKTVYEWKAPGDVNWVQWAADGRHLITLNGNKTVYVLRLNQFGGVAAFRNSIGMEFIKVPKGTGWLGGGGGKPGETKVVIEQDFYLGKYEVTQEEWEAVTGLTPSHFSRNGAGKGAVKDISDADLKRFPVESVSWDDCQLFIKRLNEKEKDTGWVYRLPKEAEWEYACRGGPVDKADSAFDFYFAKPTNTLLSEHANIGGDKGLNRTCKVGTYEPNVLGLYDMHGNVSEWCELSLNDADANSNRLLRGGSWGHNSNRCLVTVRFVIAQSQRSLNDGLRLARVPVGPPSVVPVPIVPERKAPGGLPRLGQFGSK